MPPYTTRGSVSLSLRCSLKPLLLSYMTFYDVAINMYQALDGGGGGGGAGGGGGGGGAGGGGAGGAKSPAKKKKSTLTAAAVAGASDYATGTEDDSAAAAAGGSSYNGREQLPQGHPAITPFDPAAHRAPHGGGAGGGGTVGGRARGDLNHDGAAALRVSWDAELGQSPSRADRGGSSDGGRPSKSTSPPRAATAGRSPSRARPAVSPGRAKQLQRQGTELLPSPQCRRKACDYYPRKLRRH